MQHSVKFRVWDGTQQPLTLDTPQPPRARVCGGERQRVFGSRDQAPNSVWEIREGFLEEVMFDLALKDGWELAGGRGHSGMGGRTEPGEGPGETWPGSAVLWARQVLMEWINAELLPEHIVVRSLEEDMFDGLILHHLFREWLPPNLPPAGGLLTRPYPPTRLNSKPGTLPPAPASRACMERLL